jgi:transcription-repair coupling factor (superfamily II helicase)
LELNELHQIYANHPSVIGLRVKMDAAQAPKLALSGLNGSASAVFLASSYQIGSFPALAILNDREEAAYFCDDLNALGLSEKVLFFPSSFRRSIAHELIDSENIIFRTDVLNRLSMKETGYIVVTYPEAMMEKVISQVGLEKNTLQIQIGAKYSISFIQEVLHEYGFERVEFVYEPGQYSLRGSIVDIFSYSNEDPYRIDFFGDVVDSIRTFDIEDQISKQPLTRISIIPNIQEGLPEEERVSLFDFLQDKTVVVSPNFTYLGVQLKTLYQEANTRIGAADTSKLVISSQEFKKGLDTFPCMEFSSSGYFSAPDNFEFNTTKQPVFNKNFDLLGSDLKANRQKGYQNVLLTSNPKQLERLHAIFDDKGDPQKIESLLFALNEGFVDHDLKICFYTDHQIFERYHRFKLKSKKSSRQAITIKELSKLHPGDFVVHIDHGIGKFAGLVKSEVNGNIQEAIRLIYRDNDLLLVSIHSLHRISKYRGKEGQEPSTNKLGTATWQNLKTKTKNKVKDIARELIALYAKRKMEDGFAFSADSYLQEELEASFIYEDTPDQLKATFAIKEDMEKLMPMDRLVCGDVGFGKTEIAIRAAFKAVADNKQVAVLVPTTILALQHFKTFTERLKDFPCNVQYISRLRHSGDVKQVLKDLTDGKVDILIGTHKIIGKDVKFKDLGLLIIDEEQHFGVAIKEKLKQLKANIDTLTLTATPIPRTLQFSLMGARDLSIINTPPPNRYPINTEVSEFSEEVIKEAINYEVSRGGQVFFINNRVNNIIEVERLINRLCPDVRTIVGHGQMDGEKLEKVMFDFVNGDFDVLVATTIIESGLDIPNANTIIINNAQNFGLSELHQLRGRVGRSNKKAFCYLLAPPLNVLSTDSRRRLQAIEEFSEIGSGFSIAMQDLDIRGAGNLLGGEQSGFIADIGFEAYHRILNEAMMELKSGEFQDLFEDQNSDTSEAFLDVKFVNDCNIDTDLELLFPDEYISSISERMLLYRELDTMQNEAMLEQFEKGLVDRFGPIPQSSLELIDVVRLRWIAISLHIERIILKEARMICYLPSDPASNYYQSVHFQKMMQWVVQNPSQCQVKEGRGKLSLNFNSVNTLRLAVEKLSAMVVRTMQVEV